MKKPVVLFNVLNAVSTLNQARLFEKLLNERGYDVEYYSSIPYPRARQEEVKGIWYFTLALAPWITNVTYSYFLVQKPQIVYVTIEGVPSKGNFMYSNVTRIPLIANSRFTKEMLEKAKLKVIDVIHHAIDWELSGKAIQESQKLREYLKRLYNDHVLLLYVGRHDPRKGLPILAKAAWILHNRGVRGWTLLLHTEPSAGEIEWPPEARFISHFGSKSWFDILKLMAAVDYFVFPTLCEGFGLPLLEANSVGRPVIHAWIPPLKEFSSQEFNFVFDYLTTELKEAKFANSPSQYFMLHLYPPEWLADMMQYAIQVYTQEKEQYQEYCAKAREHTKAWDYRVVYKKFLKYLKIEE